MVFLKAWLKAEGMEQLFLFPWAALCCVTDTHPHPPWHELHPESPSLLPTPHPWEPVTKLLLGPPWGALGLLQPRPLRG